MAYRKQILPEAKKEKKWHCETYGGSFSEMFEAWCESIVECAPDQRKKLLLVPLDEILNEEHSKWGYVWKNVKDQTATDRVRSLLTFLRTRKPPFELFAVHVRIHTQELFWINIIAVVHLNRVSETVVFTYFYWYGDDS
jgi:hypothetical protein